MSALPKSSESASPWWSTMEFPWAETARRAPVMVATMASYLDQLGVSARPTTVGAADQALRHFAGQVTEADPTCTSMAAVERRHIEAHKLWLAARPGKAGKPLATVTIRQSTRNVAHFLRAAAGLGLRRRSDQDADLPRRLPTGRRTAARSSSTTRRWRSSLRHWRVTPILVDASWSRSWPRPASGWASSPDSTTRP